MKRWNKTLSAALVLGMALSSVPASVMAEEAEKLDITVAGGSEDAMDVNTATTSTLEGLSAARHLFEGLYKIGESGEPELGQAASAEISEDGLTWTFTLRDDITWSDGQPVTAQDFIFGFDNLVEQADDYSSILTNVASGWEAPDDATIVITLANPCGFLPSVLAFPSTYPARKDYVEQYGDAYAADPENAVYNGAFVMTEWEHQSEMVMTAREDYYDADKLEVGTLRWMLTSDASSALAAFESGDIIYSDLCPDEEKPRMMDNGLTFAPGNMNYCVMFNQGPDGNEVLKDVNVRKALSLAIDRERIIAIRDLNDELGFTYMCSGFTNADGVDFTEYADPWYDVNDYEGNCEKAKELLAEAGYANGEGFPSLRYIVNNNDRKEVAESIVNDWKEVLGIDTVTVETDDNFFADRSAGTYDIAYYGWYMDYTDLSNMFSSINTMDTNNAFYSSEAYHAAYAAATATPDQAEQWEHYKECEAILAEDAPVAVVLHAMSSYLFDDVNYKDLVYSCGNYIFTYVKAV